MLESTPVSRPAHAAEPPVAAVTSRPAPSVPRIDSRGLLNGQRELIIEHTGLEYRLQVTRNGKLILTK